MDLREAGKGLPGLGGSSDRRLAPEDVNFLFMTMSLVSRMVPGHGRRLIQVCNE